MTEMRIFNLTFPIFLASFSWEMSLVQEMRTGMGQPMPRFGEQLNLVGIAGAKNLISIWVLLM